jgi:hypothetical protein
MEFNVSLVLLRRRICSPLHSKYRNRAWATLSLDSLTILSNWFSYYKPFLVQQTSRPGPAPAVSIDLKHLIDSPDMTVKSLFVQLSLTNCFTVFALQLHTRSSCSLSLKTLASQLFIPEDPFFALHKCSPLIESQSEKMDLIQTPREITPRKITNSNRRQRSADTVCLLRPRTASGTCLDTCLTIYFCLWSSGPSHDPPSRIIVVCITYGLPLAL